MRVLLLTQHYVPEVTACRFRMEAFTDALVTRGHQVDVVTAVPNHPQGIVQEGYRGRPLIRKLSGRIGVNYVWVHVGPEKSVGSRLLYYGSFAAAATAVGSMLARPDVILATSPPLPVATAGSVLARRFGVPWVMDVRDLWPKVASVLGELEEGPMYKMGGLLERSAYASAREVVTVTEPFADHIREQAPTGHPASVIPNGTTRKWLGYGEEGVDRAALGLPEDRFILGYAGNFGYYHALDIVAEAAAQLDDRFQLMLVGHGALGDELAKRAEELPEGRIQMMGLMEPDRAAAHLSACDALVVSLRRSLPDVLSSKLFDYCALGKPLIVSAAGETRRVVEEADAALTVEPEDPGALAAAVRRLRNEPELRERLSGAGRSLAREYLREDHAVRMAELLEETAAGRRSAIST